jgi:hypothetical protein
MTLARALGRIAMNNDMLRMARPAGPAAAPLPIPNQGGTLGSGSLIRSAISSTERLADEEPT